MKPLRKLKILNVSKVGRMNMLENTEIQHIKFQKCAVSRSILSTVYRKTHNRRALGQKYVVNILLLYSFLFG